ncbi:MAG: VTT domain-containing protein, partial [Pseudomonadota bacterium]
MDLLVHLEGPLGLAALAAIAFGDTLIGVGLFVFGEFAFLAAGAAYAANGSIVPVLVVLAFAWLGDITSFLLGRRYGARAALRFMKPSKNRKRWRRAEKMLAERGFLFVVLSRFLGPVAWITPFLSGTIRMPMPLYASAAAVGVVLGVGQFLILGAIGQTAMTYLLPHITPHLSVLALMTLMLGVGAYIWRRSVRSRLHKAMTISGASTLMLLAANFAYFFVLDSHPLPAAPQARIADVCSVSQHHLAVSPGPSALHLPQPINVLLFSEKPGAEMMAELNWHRNATYSHDAITFAKFISLLWQSRPPMSELYLDGQPADSAFQMPGS